MFRKKPCLSCVVRSCCKQECNELEAWKERYDILELPLVICMLLLASILFLSICYLAGFLLFLKAITKEEAKEIFRGI
jgi:hypothetical protein